MTWPLVGFFFFLRKKKKSEFSTTTKSNPLLLNLTSCPPRSFPICVNVTLYAWPCKVKSMHEGRSKWVVGLLAFPKGQTGIVYIYWATRKALSGLWSTRWAFELPHTPLPLRFLSFGRPSCEHTYWRHLIRCIFQNRWWFLLQAVWITDNAFP